MQQIVIHKNLNNTGSWNDGKWNHKKKKEIERVMFGNILKIESIGVNFGVNY